METEPKDVKAEGKPPENKTLVDDKKGQDKDHEPAIDSPRWKELYWKNEENKRQIERINKGREEDKGVMKEMASYNKTMRDSMNRIEDNQFTSIKEPDPVDDPEGFKDYHYNKGKHETEKTLRNKEPEAPNKVEPEKLSPQEEAISWQFPDYFEVIAEANEDIKRNPALENQFINSVEIPGNRFRAAYEHIKNKRAKLKETNDQNLNASYTEGSTTQSSNNKKKRVLTDREKQAAKKFREHDPTFTEEKYIEQLILGERDQEALNDIDRG